MTGIQLVVGLGNPGKQYEDTRHNVGVWFIEALTRQYQVSLAPETKFHGLIGQCVIDSRNCRLLVPTVFMNESGLSVSSLLNFYKIKSEHMLVVHDELDFEPGVVRLKQGGGHGGHNGLRDIVAQIGSSDFYRLRIGIGHPGNRNKVTSYVLGPPNQADKQLIDQAIDDGLRVLGDVVTGSFEQAMTYLHTD